MNHALTLSKASDKNSLEPRGCPETRLTALLLTSACQYPVRDSVSIRITVHYFSSMRITTTNNSNFTPYISQDMFYVSTASCRVFFLTRMQKSDLISPKGYTQENPL